MISLMRINIFSKNNNSSNHIHIFREGRTEFGVCTPSQKWCWKTFLKDGITEYPILEFIAIYKNKCGRPATIKFYTKQELPKGCSCSLCVMKMSFGH